MRYQKEVDQLQTLALMQLNSPKNVVKENFESMKIEDIIDKLHEEFWELDDEFSDKTFNKERIYSEIGDCAAVLAGLLAKVNSL